MYYERRHRLNELGAAEASGESFWTAEIDERARIKFQHAVKALVKDTGGYGGYVNLLHAAREAILSDEGVLNLAGERGSSDDVGLCLMTGDVRLVLSLLEAILDHAVQLISGSFSDVLQQDKEKWGIRLPAFRDSIGTVLREHRISFDLVDDKFVAVESLEMHESVVSPAITLLAGRAELADVEKAYTDALDEIHDGKPEDAITDAGTALQEMLISLGCQGNTLGPLTTDARDRGLLGPHDSKLTQAVKNAMDWVSADRSNMGDGHNATSAERDDAWLIVHIVGALILRLASETPRSG